jgi:hypothetical protein
MNSSSESASAIGHHLLRFVSVRNYRPAYPLTRLPAYPLTRLPAYPLTRLPAYPLTRCLVLP